jgi:acetyl-CoA carboxylase biotin carboxyl carrier protein
MTLDIRKIKKLIELVTESGIDELDITEGDSAIRIRRQAGSAGQTRPSPRHDTQSMDNVIRSPLVGTFHLAPSPEARAFVEVGSCVRPGDTLCVIEAMGMMNQIRAETEGEIQAIRAKPGDRVEFDQPLFLMTP